jgi:actin-related protein
MAESVAVIDLGSSSVKAGWAGDDVPSLIFPSVQAKDSSSAGPQQQRQILFNEQPNVLLLCKTIVHAADLSNPVRRFTITRRWAELIATEFNAQVAKEEELGLPILGFMVSHNLKMVCKNEMGFSSFVVAPMWRCLETILPELHFLVTQLDSNQAEWKSIIDQIEAEEEDEEEHSESGAANEADKTELEKKAEAALSTSSTDVESSSGSDATSNAKPDAGSSTNNSTPKPAHMIPNKLFKQPSSSGLLLKQPSSNALLAKQASSKKLIIVATAEHHSSNKSSNKSSISNTSNANNGTSSNEAVVPTGSTTTIADTS